MATAQSVDLTTGEILTPDLSAPVQSAPASADLLDAVVARSQRIEVTNPAQIAAIMRQKDEASILAAAEGVATDEWFYEFWMGNKKVVGIGVEGADELARMRAEQGFPLKLSQWDVREVMRDNEAGIQAMVCMRDAVSGQEAPAFCFYPHRMEVTRKVREGGVEREVTEIVRDRHNDRKAFGVAKRNSILQLTPAETKAALIARKKELHQQNAGKLAERAKEQREQERGHRRANQPIAIPAGDAYAADAGQSAKPAAAPAPARQAAAPATGDVPACPKCGGRMWDNRNDKRNPKAPDFKCRDRACGEGVWLDSKKSKAQPASAPAPQFEDYPMPDDDDLEGM